MRVQSYHYLLSNLVNIDMNSKLRQIAVSEDNYLALKGLGRTGDSFNDVLTEVLKKVKKPLHTDDIRVGGSVHQSATDGIGTDSESDSIHG
jgi:predicted CopG family antitoxin